MFSSEEAAKKLGKTFNYGLVAMQACKTGYDAGYEDGYKQCIKDVMAKYDLTDIDVMCDDVAKELGEQ
jgi:hypothetical protein